MKKYFYGKNALLECDYNITYEELLLKNKQELEEWLDGLRAYIVSQWDDNGLPPRIGQDESGIRKQFSKLQRYNVFHKATKREKGSFEKSGHKDHFLQKDELDGTSTVIRNFNKFATSVDQFFPTMLKTKIAMGGSKAWSVYDYFALTEKRESFHTTMRRNIRRDSFFAYSKTIKHDDSEVPYPNTDGETWIREFTKTTLHADSDFWIIELFTEKNFESYEKDYLTLTANQIKTLYNEGTIQRRHVTNLETSADYGETTETLDDKQTDVNGKVTNYKFAIRYYKKNKRLFPAAIQSFRIGLGQPAVNFPPLTAKYIYQEYTKDIKDTEPLVVYDPSSGWGGRILGAMSIDDRQLHYVGTDPNPDNYINDLDKSRYEYLADWFNENTNGGNPFFGHQNTYELFQDGSEDIADNPRFQKYKGKLDLVFTSPPYFNREQYSEDESQSFKKFAQYDDWRDNFLRPTLTTCAEYLKNDRYLLWNIADLLEGGTELLPLEKDSRDILEEVGLEYIETLKMVMASMMGVDPNNVKNCCKVDGEMQKYEPIFVFKKG